jgi:GDP-L-fucose synthase
MMRRFHEAKQSGASEVVVWGTGTPMRELINCDDLANACVFLMQNYDAGGLVNAGSSSEVSIRSLAYMLSEVTGFSGAVRFDVNRPDGTPRKIMDNRILHGLGWKPQVSLENGLRQMYEWWLSKGAP